MSESDDTHPCVIEGCKNVVPFDDEPTCYTHSPNSGSNIPGYSYKRAAERVKESNDRSL